MGRSPTLRRSETFPRERVSRRPRSGVAWRRERLDEVLQLARGPALERLAVVLVRRDDRVAVVPVQARLGVQPEGASGARGHLGEDVGARVAAVGARVTEDYHR